jgi:hypothetical protein
MPWNVLGCKTGCLNSLLPTPPIGIASHSKKPTGYQQLNLANNRQIMCAVSVHCCWHAVAVSVSCARSCCATNCVPAALCRPRAAGCPPPAAVPDPPGGPQPVGMISGASTGSFNTLNCIARPSLPVLACPTMADGSSAGRRRVDVRLMPLPADTRDSCRGRTGGGPTSPGMPAAACASAAAVSDGLLERATRRCRLPAENGLGPASSSGVRHSAAVMVDRVLSCVLRARNGSALMPVPLPAAGGDGDMLWLRSGSSVPGQLSVLIQAGTASTADLQSSASRVSGCRMPARSQSSCSADSCWKNAERVGDGGE